MKNLIINSMPAIVFLGVFVLVMKLLPPIGCNDGESSSSFGKQGACSHHGGVSSWQPMVSFLVSSAATVWYLIFLAKKVLQALKPREVRLEKINRNLREESAEF